MTNSAYFIEEEPSEEDRRASQAITAFDFPETPEEELLQIRDEFLAAERLAATVNFLAESGEDLPKDVRAQIVDLIRFFSDLVSPDLPEIDDMDSSIIKAAQELNLSRVLKERALVRLYRLITVKDDKGVPRFMSMFDTDTGAQFKRQDDFLDWFRRNAKVSRSLVFLRKKTYDRMTRGLKLTLEEAYRLILTKPTVIHQALDSIGEWSKQGSLLGVSDDVASKVAELLPMGPDRQAIENAIISGNEGDLIQAVRPAFLQLIEEVASNPNAKDAMDYVNHDVLGKPVIKAWWDDDIQCPVVQIEVRDDKGNLEYVQTARLMPDVPELDPRMARWIADKLQVRNRDTLAL